MFYLVGCVKKTIISERNAVSVYCIWCDKAVIKAEAASVCAQSYSTTI